MKQTSTEKQKKAVPDSALDSLISASAASSWMTALIEAAKRRDFLNLQFAERWIRSLSKAGMYPRWRGDTQGE